MEESQKVVLYLGGGAMAGVFGGGVLSTLDRAGFQENIEAIYSVSAGSLNGAYFLTNEVEKGVSIYLENLPGNFIHLIRIPAGIAQLLWNRYARKLSPNGHIYNVIDIDFLFRVVSNVKKLNLSELIKQGKNFYIKLLNIETGECEYLNITGGAPLDILQAAVTVKPYYFPYQTINNKKYIDGGVKEQFGIDFLLKKYPDRKIIAIFNEPISWRIKYPIKNFLEGLISALYPYDCSLFKLFLKREKLLREDLKKAASDPRVLLIYCPKRNGIMQIARKPKKLIEHYRLGEAAGQEILDFIRKDGPLEAVMQNS